MTSVALDHQLKVAGRHYGRRVTSQRASSEVRSAADRKAKVKVSTLLSPESQKAMMMVKEESARQRKMAHEKPKPASAAALTSPVPPRLPPLPTTTPRTSVRDVNDNVRDHDTVRDSNANNISDVTNDASDGDNVGFGAKLNKVCTTRLPGDITDKSYTPRPGKKRALRFGDRLHTAMEVVEIVVYGGADDDKKDDVIEEDSEDEEEAIQRAADVSSHERCQAWVELHFDTDDASSQSSAER